MQLKSFWRDETCEPIQIFVSRMRVTLLDEYYLQRGNLVIKHLKELPRVKRILCTGPSWRPKKVNFLVFQKFYLTFAVFLSKFIKTYILLNFIQY